MSAQPAMEPAGPWAPLRVPTFRALWLAILVGNIGTWIHDIAASWIMAETTGSPMLVAAVQAATTLPMVLLAVFAGTLADIIDRRRYLIVVQLWLLVMASTLALISHWGMATPWVLVGFTFALGVGAAMAMPAQQATTPELVPRQQLGAAVALGSLSVNIARSIGPAVGGWIVAQWSVTAAFAVNAISFLGILLVLIRWKPRPVATTLPPEPFGSALRAGLRYALHATIFQSVLIKAALFFACASALTALLPIVVSQGLRAGAGTYGILLGCIGVGAITGALQLSRLRKRFDADQLVLAATLAYGGGMLLFAWLRHAYLLFPVAFACGLAWITVLSSFQVAAQSSVPPWVRARSIALYLTVFSAGMAGGSLGWGAIAQASRVEFALLAAGAGTIVAGLLAWRFKVAPADNLDLQPSGHWPAPQRTDGSDEDRGPVLVTAEYQVAIDQRAAFLALMHALGRSRRRDGAIQWGVMEDTTSPGRYLEYFLTPSWVEHLRQHERVTGEDRALQARIRALHVLPDAPVVRHFVGGYPAAASLDTPADRPGF